MSDAVLRCRSVTMSFPGTLALDDVGFDIRAGEVHALVGQNGSGKSTVIKVLAGYHVPGEGSRVEVCGRPLEFGSAAASRSAGLRFVHQDLGLIPQLSVLENMGLTNRYDSRPGRPIRWRAVRRRARAALADLGYDIDVLAPVSTLSASQRTGVALARMLDGWDHGAQVLVFDEPTAALPRSEAQKLFDVIDGLRNRGMAILYVSHHLDEILQIADRVTTLRGGRVVSTLERRGLTHDGLIELLVGRALAGPGERTGVATAAGPTALRVSGLAGGRLGGLDLDVRSGEIVGLAGLAGSGREEFSELVFGAAPRGGEVLVAGRAVLPDSPVRALAAGLALLPADRKEQGIFAAMTVRENLVVSSLPRRPTPAPLRTAVERLDVQAWIRRLRVTPEQTEVPIAALSGGNQQKVIIAKWLRTRPKVLLLDEPTQGVDVGSRAEIYRELRAVAAAGCGVVICSSDSQELAELCDRVVVLVRGQVAVELPLDRLDPDVIDGWCLSTSTGQDAVA